MKTTLDEGTTGKKKDEDVDMARHLESGGPGDGVMGEADKGIVVMILDFPFSLNSSW